MFDPRVVKLAETIIEYSVELKKGEKILIDVSGLELPLAQALIRHTYKIGAVPFISISDSTLQREMLMGLSLDQAKAMAEWDLLRMKYMQAYVGIRAGHNVNELSDVPSEKMQVFMNHYSKPVHLEQRVKHTRWCILRYPNPSMAQLAEMSTEGFADLYYKVCTLDYSKLSAAMNPLVSLLEKTDRVRIAGPGTDLTFSIKGMPAIKCDGKMNLPDGEIFTAPVKESVNGTIKYNTPTLYQGTTYENIEFKFEEGKIIEASANNTEKLKEVLDTDQGARYIGEFAIGVNPFIKKPMKDILFDEKIDGSFHFTPGSAYDECNNGNESAIHWDLVCIQRPEYGGGEIYFDDVLVRKDGRFVLDELKDLNPENYK